VPVLGCIPVVIVRDCCTWSFISSRKIVPTNRWKFSSQFLLRVSSGFCVLFGWLDHHGAKMTQLSSFWLVSLTPGVIISRLVCIDEMQNQSEKRRPGDGKKSLRWPSLPDEVLLSKTPKWLKSLSFHHRHNSPVSSASFVLPKLPGSDNHFHQPEEESSDVQTGQVHLPPLCFSSGSTGLDDKARSSWLLPTFPAFHRKEVYHRQAAARERRQLSAKLARLPPITTTTSSSSSTSPQPTVQSSSAPPPRSPRG
jgi:hypothetical protein